MTKKSRSELAHLMRNQSEKMIVITALLFLTIASLWTHFALGPLVTQPTIYLAWLLIHSSAFLILRYPRLEKTLIIATFFSLEFYFRNCIVLFKVPFLPVAPTFFLIAALTITGYRSGQWKRAAVLWAVGWASAFYWLQPHEGQPKLATQAPMWIGAALSFLFFASFIGMIELFGRRMIQSVRALGPRNDYDDKRIHASKLQTLGELAASVVHEINTPLTSIKGYNHQFKAELTESANPDKELLINFSERIAFNLDRVVQITKVMRNFSRDPSRDELIPTSIKEVFNDTLTLLRPHLKASGVELIVDIPEKDVQVRGSVIQLSQLLVNLLNNARDAVLESDRKKVLLGFSAHGDRVQIWVEDTGKGIPDELQKEVYRPFFTTKEVGRGTGLGLYISHIIAERHQARLEFSCPRDSSGKVLGTRFVLELAVLSQDSAAGTQAA